MSGMTVAKNRWPARVAATFGLLVMALALLVAPGTPASAHAVLASSSPVPDTVLSSAPAEVVLTFSEPVRQVPGKIRVLGPDGSRVDRGEPTFDGALVRIPVDPGGARGTYLVSYRVISADSHPVAGGYTYSVGAPSTPPADSDTGSAVDSVVAVAVPVAKYVGYVGLVLLAGVVLVLSLLWPQRLSRHRAARLAWTGLGLVAFATLAGLWLQVPYTNGGGLFSVDGSALTDVLGSPFGAAHLVRLGILVAIGILLRPLLAGRSGPVDQWLLVILGLGALATWPIAGHPAASPVPAVSVVVDAVHLGSMAIWLGGLTMLVAVLLRQADERELTAIMPVWSRWATAAVSALVLAGTVQALIEVGTPAALVSTRYGWLLLAKVGLFALVIAVAAYSRQLVRRRAAADEPGRIRRAVWAELGITAVILAVAAALVQTTPARTADADAPGGGTIGYYATTLTSNLYSLELVVDPAEVGSNTLHLDVFTPDRKPLPVVEWRVTAALPAQGIEPIEVPLLPLTDNHATGEIKLPARGDWQLRITVRTSEIDQATVIATVPIK
ncbi:copper resistance CopC/CopD family protein [Micromonospora polyrhachis]|nr:copper resistance protein CopC [Micromonospora polyrhachis]